MWISVLLARIFWERFDRYEKYLKKYSSNVLAAVKLITEMVMLIRYWICFITITVSLIN